MFHPSTFATAGRLTPRTFFDDVCPKLLRRRPAEKAGRFGFLIDGAGAWTIDLEKHAVMQGAAHDSDVCIAMSAADFTALLAGELDMPAAYRGGALRVGGAAEKLAILIKLFGSHEG